MLCDALCQALGGRLCYTSAFHHFPTNVHQTIEEGASSNNYALGVYLCTPDGLHAYYLFCGPQRCLGIRDSFAIRDGLNEELIDLVLPNVKILGFIEYMTPFPDKLSSIALGTGTPYGRPFTYVQHTKLDGGSISYPTHLTA